MFHFVLSVPFEYVHMMSCLYAIRVVGKESCIVTFGYIFYKECTNACESVL